MKILKTLTLYPIAIKFPVIFFTIFTIIGFYIRLKNGGWLLLFFIWMYLIIIAYDVILVILMLLLPYVRGKKFSEKFYSLIWLYSWIQLLALVLTIDGGDDSSIITWIPRSFWAYGGDFVREYFGILFFILHFIQFAIAILILALLKDEKKDNHLFHDKAANFY